MKKIFISLITIIILLSSFSINVNAIQKNNNTPNQIKNIKINGKTTVHIDSNAVYKFNVIIPSAGYLDIKIKSNDYINGSSYWYKLDIDLKNTNNIYVSGVAFYRGYLIDGVFSTSCIRKGQYYLEFSSNGAYYDTDVTIETSFERINSADDSFNESIEKNNDSFMDAYKISFDKKYNALVEYQDYDDYYKFELKDKFTNPHLYIKETENDSIDYIQIFDRNRNSVYYSKVNTLLDEDLNTELTKGTYYLYVKGNFVGKYSFKLTKTYFGWMQGKYWYENGVRQAVPGDPKNITDTIYGHERGREIYDPDSDGWYWLDAIYDGAKATSKEVWMPYIYQNEKPGSTLGKWVRYDENGKMYKGLVTIDYWYENPEQNGNTYYYEPITGGMIKGYRNIDGKDYYFDEFTGVLR